LDSKELKLESSKHVGYFFRLTARVRVLRVVGERARVWVCVFVRVIHSIERYHI
jgi:hypothetical protein